MKGSLVWLSSGICFALISVHHVFWLLLIPAFVCLLYVFEQVKNWRQVFWLCWFVGTMSAFGGYSFVWETYPLTWIDIGSPVVQLAFIFSYWLTTSAAMGLGPVIPGLLIYRLYQWRPIYAALAFPLAWVMGEILGSLFSSIILLGPGSYLNINIAHGYTGLALSHLALLFPFIKIGGVYALSFLAALLGLISYLILVRKNISAWSLLVFAFVLLTIYLIFPPQLPPTTNTKVLAVDLNFSSAEWHQPGGPVLKQKLVQEATFQALKSDSDIILLSEDARLTKGLGGPTTTLAFLQKWAPEQDTLVVESSRITDETGKAVLRGYYYDLAKGTVYEIDKQFLVPQGEYVTYLYSWIIKMIVPDEVYQNLQRDVNYRPGPKDKLEDLPKNIPALMFCFDNSSVFGAYNIKTFKDNPIILHSVSHSWFHQPVIYWDQLKGMLRTQSIWNQTIIVKAGNMSPSRTYLPNGQIIEGELKAKTRYWSIVEYQL